MTRTFIEVSGAEAALIFSWFHPIPPDLIHQDPIKQKYLEDAETLHSANYVVARKLIANSTKIVLFNQPQLKQENI